MNALCLLLSLTYTTRDLTVVLEHFELLYVDAHEPSLDARREKLSLQYATKIKSLPKHHANNAVFDNKYMKMRPSAIRTIGLRIK